MSVTVVCPVCSAHAPDVAALASHLVEQAECSDDAHVMWLNRHVTKHRMSPAALEPLLREERAGGGSSGERVAR